MEFRTLRARNPGPLTLEGTNTYVFGGMVIDPGPDDERHLRSILEAGPVERILLTHHHRDHSGGAARLSGLSGAPVLAFGAGLVDGEVVSGLEIVHTPGHAPDHLCFWHAESRTLLSGDLIAGRGSIIVAPPEGDLDEYMASLRRVRALRPARILPGHGPAAEDGAAKIEEYISHRRDREARIAAALRSGASSLQDVVEMAYADVPPSMRPYAELGARAHLARLGHPMFPA